MSEGKEFRVARLIFCFLLAVWSACSASSAAETTALAAPAVARLINAAEKNVKDAQGWADDLLEGGAGIDRIWGQAGNDIILGGDGDDFLDGREGLLLAIANAEGSYYRYVKLMLHGDPPR